MKSKIHSLASSQAETYLKSERELFGTLLVLDREKAFEEFEYTHLTPYCVKKLGLSEDIAKCFVRVVRKSHEVPELGAAVVSGKVLLYKARAICSVLTVENQTEWIKKAQDLPKSKLEQEVAAAKGETTRRVPLNLSFETLEKLARARDVASSKEAAYLTLEETIDRALNEYLYRNDPVEKAARSKKPNVKHEVNLRDLGRCQFVYEDGSQCEEEKWIEQHHQIHRSQRGPDTLENLISLCASHHRMIHR